MIWIQNITAIKNKVESRFLLVWFMQLKFFICRDNIIIAVLDNLTDRFDFPYMKHFVLSFLGLEIKNLFSKITR